MSAQALKLLLRERVRLKNNDLPIAVYLRLNKNTQTYILWSFIVHLFAR